MKIPRIIHQTWKTTDIPYDIYKKKWIDSWKNTLPDWQYTFWTDEDLYQLVSEKEPEFLSTYTSYKYPINRVDAARFIILYHHGGLYVDLDFMCLKDIEPLFADYDLVFSQVGFSKRNPHSLSNAIMASVPGHPFWRFAIERLSSPENNVSAEEVAGPVFLKKTYKAYKKLHPDALSGSHIFPSKILCPIDWKNHSVYKNSVPENVMEDPKACCPESYAITFWTHNWSGPTSITWNKLRGGIFSIIKFLRLA